MKRLTARHPSLTLSRIKTPASSNGRIRWSRNLMTQKSWIEPWPPSNGPLEPVMVFRLRR